MRRLAGDEEEGQEVWYPWSPQAEEVGGEAPAHPPLSRLSSTYPSYSCHNHAGFYFTEKHKEHLCEEGEVGGGEGNK